MSAFCVSLSAALVSFLSIIAGCAPGIAVNPGDKQVAAPVPGDTSAGVSKEAWETEWEKLVSAAKKEGRVAVISTGGGELGREMAEGFQKAYGIPAEFTGGKGVQVAEKLISERRAGLYLYDVYIGGAQTPINVLKPAGVLAPLESALVLPDVTNPVRIKEVWYGGELSWNDKDRMVLGFILDVNLGITVNTDFVKPAEFTSYNDLLNPKWRGKIVMNDPTLSGSGGKWATVIGSKIMGWDFLRELAKQNPAIVTDERLQGTWIAQGKYPIGIAPKTEIITAFKKAGVPLANVVPREGTYDGGGGTGYISLINKAPHANAAKVFINWYLTREAQSLHVSKVGKASMRRDVSTEGIDPSLIPQPGIKYADGSSEAFSLKYPELLEKSREIFLPLKK